jgi:hypothetical protein
MTLSSALLAVASEGAGNWSIAGWHLCVGAEATLFPEKRRRLIWCGVSRGCAVSPVIEPI